MSETPDRQYAHEIYPHPGEDETRPLDAQVLEGDARAEDAQEGRP